MDIRSLITNDLEFVMMMHDKYNYNIASWYARLASQETHEEWIERRIKLSLDTNEVKGILLCSNGISIVYTIHVPFSPKTQVTIVRNGIIETTSSYEKLYQTLENLAQVQ